MGSPFSATVSVPHADARQCRLSGLGLSEAVAGEQGLALIWFALSELLVVVFVIIKAMLVLVVAVLIFI